MWLLARTVIATTSTEEKASLAREAGADHTIGYEGFGERVLELTDGAGAPVADAARTDRLRRVDSSVRNVCVRPIAAARDRVCEETCRVRL